MKVQTHIIISIMILKCFWQSLLWSLLLNECRVVFLNFVAMKEILIKYHIIALTLVCLIFDLSLSYFIWQHHRSWTKLRKSLFVFVVFYKFLFDDLLLMIVVMIFLIFRKNTIALEKNIILIKLLSSTRLWQTKRNRS